MPPEKIRSEASFAFANATPAFMCVTSAAAAPGARWYGSRYQLASSAAAASEKSPPTNTAWPQTTTRSFAAGNGAGAVREDDGVDDCAPYETAPRPASVEDGADRADGTNSRYVAQRIRIVVSQRARAVRNTQDTTTQFARSSVLPTKPRTPPPRRFFELSSRSAAPSMSNPRRPRGGCWEGGWQIGERQRKSSSRSCARGWTASTVAAVAFERREPERTCAGYARPPVGRENIIQTASARLRSAGRCGREQLRTCTVVFSRKRR